MAKCCSTIVQRRVGGRQHRRPIGSLVCFPRTRWLFSETARLLVLAPIWSSNRSGVSGDGLLAPWKVWRNGLKTCVVIHRGQLVRCSLERWKMAFNMLPAVVLDLIGQQPLNSFQCRLIQRGSRILSHKNNTWKNFALRGLVCAYLDSDPSVIVRSSISAAVLCPL